MSHKDTMLYKTQLLRASRDRDDIFELIPKASIESYETYLFNPDLKKNGKIVKIGKMKDIKGDESLEQVFLELGEK